jgi:MvaI/BcnI restriction endonuclease family
MSFQSVDQLLTKFKALGAERVFCKHLSENDNSKQQIYLGKNFEVLSAFPHGKIVAYPNLNVPNFKAPLEFFWVNSESVERAKGTQLIFYPAYPEVRLSGFLEGCKNAPSANLRQIPREQRRGVDGRVLIFGTTADRKTFAFLAPESSRIAEELIARFKDSHSKTLFLELTLPIASDQNKSLVLDALRAIHRGGLHASCRRDRTGIVIPYKATNGGGYTLEALLGITPNGDAAPDYLGWEIKAYGKDKVTVMTPEPTGGFYGLRGVREFVMKYGHESDDGANRFNGVHKVGTVCKSTGLTLHISGFDRNNPEKLDVSGAIQLIDTSGNQAATWEFSGLLTHWNKKHAFAAYVPYSLNKDGPTYKFNSPVLMGENTDFSKYLSALFDGAIVFDPGSSVSAPVNGKSTVKARSQFRINTKQLSMLYERLTAESIT